MNVAKLRPRGSQCELPHLPPVARDPLDDAREVLAIFAAKQAGSSDVAYADLAEDLAVALKVLLAMQHRPGDQMGQNGRQPRRKTAK